VCFLYRFFFWSDGLFPAALMNLVSFFFAPPPNCGIQSCLSSCHTLVELLWKNELPRFLFSFLPSRLFLCGPRIFPVFDSLSCSTRLVPAALSMFPSWLHVVLAWSTLSCYRLSFTFKAPILFFTIASPLDPFIPFSPTGLLHCTEQPFSDQIRL